MKNTFLPFIAILSLLFIKCQKEFRDETKAINLPVISDTKIVNVTQTKATIYASVVSDGGSQITERGVCYDTVSAPTVSNLRIKNDTASTGTFTVLITGLNPNTKYYARAYAVNKYGTSYGEEVNFIIEIKIGAEYGGGIVFYLDEKGEHGLISHKQGLDYAATWGCKGVSVQGTKTELGSGQANTSLIVAA